jgi:hypothetical protein
MISFAPFFTWTYCAHARICISYAPSQFETLFWRFRFQSSFLLTVYSTSAEVSGLYASRTHFVTRLNFPRRSFLGRCVLFTGSFMLFLFLFNFLRNLRWLKCSIFHLFLLLNCDLTCPTVFFFILCF